MHHMRHFRALAARSPPPAGGQHEVPEPFSSDTFLPRRFCTPERYPDERMKEES